MKIKSVLLGQTVRYLKAYEPVGKVYIPDLISLLNSKYSFVTAPSSPDKILNISNGLTFEHGKFIIQSKSKTRQIIIDKFQLFTTGLLVNTRSYVEDSEEFLNNVIDSICICFGDDIYPEKPGISNYTSSLEVEMQIKREKLFSEYKFINNSLSSALQRYGHKHQLFQTSGITMQRDPSSNEFPSPVSFTFQLREEVSLDENLYFTNAPLNTADHIKLLNKIESTFS